LPASAKGGPFGTPFCPNTDRGGVPPAHREYPQVRYENKGVI